MSQGIDKPTENWTRFPNCILDNLDRYKPNELKVLAFMIRKTLGFRDKANRMFAAEYVAKRLDMSEKTARTAIDGLEESGTIRNIGVSGRMGIKLYEVVWRRPVKITDRQTVSRPVKITGDARQKLPTVLDNQHKDNQSKPDDGFTLTPHTFENTKTSKKVPSDKDKAKLDEIKKIGEPVFDLLTELGFEKMNKSKEMCELVARAVKECGVDFVLRGVRGRVKSHEGKDPYWRFFFKDTVQISTAAASVKQSSGGGFNKVWQEAI